MFTKLLSFPSGTGLHRRTVTMTLFSVLATLPVSVTVTGKTVFPDLPSLLEAQSDKLSSLSGWLATQPLITSVLGRAGEVTLLAPSNDAISAISESPFGTQLEEDSSLLTAYLAYHVFPGVWPLEALADATDPVFPMTLMNYVGFANVTGGQVLRSVVRDGVVFLGSGGGAESPVIAADLTYTGGIVHIIDSPLYLPTLPSNEMISDGLTASVGALRRSGLEPSLNQDWADLTIFAPNNDAFGAIGSEVDNLTDEQLLDIMKYHVVRDFQDSTNGVLYSTDLRNGVGSKYDCPDPLEITTAQGTTIYVRVIDEEIYVNSARVIATDWLVGNGVIHILDGVLNPLNPTATPTPFLKTQPPAWPSAHSTPGGIPFTSGIALETAVVTVTATATLIPTEIPIPSDASAVRPWFEPFREDRKKRPIWVSVVWGLGMAMVFAVLMA